MDQSILDTLLLNTANVMYVICYGVRDVLWLRILAVAAMGLLIPYYISNSLFTCVYWQLIFMSINMAWIVYIILQRRPPRMTEDEQRIYNNVFRESCTPKQMLRLLKLAEWSDASVNTRLIAKGQDPHQLILIDQGDAVVQVNGKRVANVGRGDFVAEMSFLTGKQTVADVIATGAMRYLVWHRESLDRLFEKQIELKSILNELIGRNLVEKITSSQEGEGLLSTIQIDAHFDS